MSLQNQSWSGAKQQPAVWDHPGTYGGSPWSVELAPNSGAQQIYAASIAGSWIGLHNLTAKHGFRCFSIRNVTDILLDSCHAIEPGIPGSSWGSGGQGFYADHVSRLTVQDCTCQNPAGHGIYLAETIQTARLLRLQFSGGPTEHACLFQLNSEGGDGITDIEVHGSVFVSQSHTIPCANFLGCGLQNAPVLVQGCKFQGGRNVAVDRGGPRPAFVRFVDTQMDQPLLVGPGSVVWLVGTSKSIKTTGPGKVVRQ